MKQRFFVVSIGIFFLFCALCSLFFVSVRASVIPVCSGYGNETVYSFLETNAGVSGVISNHSSTYLVGASAGGNHFCTEIYPGGSAMPCSAACGYSGTFAMLFNDGSQSWVVLADSWGNTIESYTLSLPAGSVLAMAVDGSNRVWISSGHTLTVFGSGGKQLAIYDLPSPARSLCVAEGVLFAFCPESGVLAADTSSVPDGLYGMGYSGTLPMVSLGDGYFQDASGNFCYYGSGEISYAGASGLPPRYTYLASAAVSGEYAVFGEGTNTITVCDLWSGETQGHCTVPGTILAMAGDAVLLRTDENEIGVAFLDYDSETEPEPPASSEEESSVPGENDFPEGVYRRGDYLEVRVGITVSQLKKSESVTKVWDASGEEASGACRTGMSAKLNNGETLPIVVPGDANGSGTVNSADIRAVQQAILGEAELSGVYEIAADVDRNGRVDTHDLLLIIRMFREEG